MLPAQLSTETSEAPPQETFKFAPPPPIEGVQRPPVGSDPLVIQDWIFTLLHAQTENLIYMRERVNDLEKGMDELLKIIRQLL